MCLLAFYEPYPYPMDYNAYTPGSNNSIDRNEARGDRMHTICLPNLSQSDIEQQHEQ